MTFPTVSVDATGPEWDEAPWPSAFGLAELLPRGSWTMVGGLMVRMHAALADLPASRTTVDVDTALHLETNSVTFAQAAAALEAAGYVLDRSTRYAYRFDRGQERVDVMCSDRHAIWRGPRFEGRPLFGVPGGTRALQQTINMDLRSSSRVVRIIVPSLRGALVLKGAALLEDSRDRERHAEDGVLLLACAAEPADLVSGLSQRSRRRLRALVRHLTDRATPWTSHDPVVQALARESVRELASRLAV